MCSIFIKDDEEWTNPEYLNSILDGEYSSSAKTEIARKASSNWMIPLFSLMSGSESPLHKKAVEQIAFRRKKDLQAKIEDGAIDIQMSST